MARVFIDLKLSGTVDNAVATELIGQAAALWAACREAGLELRGQGIESALDEEPPVVVPDPEPDPEPEPEGA